MRTIFFRLTDRFRKAIEIRNAGEVMTSAKAEKKSRMLPILLGSLVLFTALPALSATSVDVPDLRDHQHGIDFLKKPDGTYYVVWASQGNPPSNSTGNWTHDIYSMPIDPASPKLGTITTRISAGEAQ